MPPFGYVEGSSPRTRPRYYNPSLDKSIRKEEEKARLREAKAQAKALAEQRKTELEIEAYNNKLQQKLEKQAFKKSYGLMVREQKDKLERKMAKVRAENEARSELGLKPAKSKYLPSRRASSYAASYFAKAQPKKFAGYLKGIAQAAPRQVQPAYNAMQPQVQPRPQRPTKLRNFFAHKDPIEVYGDDGLTFFDSDKRADDDTGSLFGL